MVDLGGTFKAADHIGKERKTPAKISIFSRPVSNTIKQKKYSWPGLCGLLTGEPEAIPNNTSDIKAEYGDYYVRGDINGNRDDEHLGDCCLLIMDIDKPVDGLPLPTPEESHQALKGTTHAVHSSATLGRSRIIFPVEIYQKEDTEKLTKAAYVFCRSRVWILDMLEDQKLNLSRGSYHRQLTLKRTRHMAKGLNVLFTREENVFTPKRALSSF